MQDRFERENDAFHQRVRAAYRDAGGPGVVHLDATLPKTAVLDAAWRELQAVTVLTTRGIS